MEKPDKLEVWDEAKLRLRFSNGPLLINTEGNHYKFWHYDRSEQRVYWGRIGKKFQSMNVSDRPGVYIQGRINNKKSNGYKELE